MARESIPHFDLYNELEVAPSASMGVIEAAYRSLVKDHHPDVAKSSDTDRIKRLNVAREWLTDPDRRRRYDSALRRDGRRGGTAGTWTSSTGPASRRSTTGRPSTDRRRTDGAGAAGSAASAGSSSGPASRRRTASGSAASAGARFGTAVEGADTPSFGVNAADVRQFLADLRTLDEPRAAQVLAGRAVARAVGYVTAHRGALATAERRRHREWLFAREAASVVVRGKLGESDLTADVIEVLGDVTGAIAIRDLLPPSEFEVLLTPWTWRDPALSERVRRGWSASAPAPKPNGTNGDDGTARTTATPPHAAPSVTSTPVAQPQPRETPPPPAVAPGPMTPGPMAPRPMAPRPASSAPPTAATRPVAVARPAAVSRRAAIPAAVALVTLVALAAAIAAVNGQLAADVVQPSSAVAAATVPFTPAPTRVAGALPIGPGATPAPTLPATPALDPAEVRRLQRAALRTIRELRAAAGSGDVAAAQVYLGGTAPNLQPSGLRRATFPDVRAADLEIEASAGGWIASAGEDILTSADGERWTFDYGERPLAVFGESVEHNLYWLDPRRDIHLRVASVSVTRSVVSVRFEWRYGRGGADAAAFDRGELAIASLRIGSHAVPGPSDAFVRLGAFDGSATIRIAGDFGGATRLDVTAAVHAPSIAGFTTIETTYTLGG